MKNKSSFTVRQEREAEFPAIYELIRTAFATAEVSDGDEQDFANRLRIHGNYIRGMPREINRPYYADPDRSHPR